MNGEEEDDEGVRMRADARDSLFLLTKLAREDGTPIGPARIRNLSATGMMIDCATPVAPGTRLRFDIRGIGELGGTVVRTDRDRVGVRLDREIDPMQARTGRSAGAGAGRPTLSR